MEGLSRPFNDNQNGKKIIEISKTSGAEKGNFPRIQTLEGEDDAMDEDPSLIQPQNAIQTFNTYRGIIIEYHEEMGNDRTIKAI